MKSIKNTIFINALIAAMKAQSAYMILKSSSSLSAATVPILSIILLIISSILIWKQIRIGAIIALCVIGFFLIQFILLGLVQKLMAYFVIHVAGMFFNWAVLSELSKNKRENCQQT